MTLKEYLAQLVWSKTELSREAKIDFKTARKAIDGQEITARPARAIASALSEALKSPVTISSIDDLKVRS